MNTYLIISIVLAILFLISYLIGLFVYKIIRCRVLKLYIVPFFKTQGQEISKVRFAGLFGGGNYELSIKPLILKNAISTNYYINIYIKQKGSIAYRYTAKITTIFLYIKRVELKGNGIYAQIKGMGL